MHVKKGDTVVVISGKDKGKVGKVLTAMPKKDRVVVEGVNIVVKHKKPSQQMQQGGRIEKEGAIHASNVMLYCNKEKKGVRIGHKIENGKKTRVCAKCGEILD
ncbi:50S ribosomal protein L24 [Gottschalkia acidurici 9a]|uniref:Large ribosomal subunit protein uL24 n=1 Tax=Gottschalkia acidurici (strain ATCC 7906 / DSM 604 / BCRC 14475 / CIP 104303 / KCTC 5404 / NCIMB 10678 / 9a) TaxID=1128398 RepID=K0B2U7_GOTA9|nr:50S ribosomal protein L24 [Gottschalkia acidurici]AFS79255.1 50S ribosomal protein L24 [Gottschalkia acidurici 9a]